MQTWTVAANDSLGWSVRKKNISWHAWQMSQTVWNREELYEKVWAQPVVHVAKEYGVSDVAIAKVCRKLNVPLPGRGYWARKQYGYAVSRKPLPQLKEPIVVTRNAPTLNTFSTPTPPPPLHSDDQTEFARIDKLATDGAFNFAASTKALRHPLIVQTRQALREGSLDDRRILRPKYQARSLNVRVGKDSVKRALELLASIIATAERHDAQIAVSQGDRQWETSFVAFGQRISFSISEKAHHRILDPPPEQRPGHYVRIITLLGKPIEYVPTGKLTLSIKSFTRRSSSSIRCLNCLSSSSLLRRASASAACFKRSRRRGIAALIGCIRESVSPLSSSRLPAALAVIDAKKASGEELGPDTPCGIWTVWALQQADRLDPLAKNPPSILDRKKELPRDDMPSWGR